MKKFTKSILAVLAFGLCLSAQAATVTNADGTTFTVGVLSESAATLRDATVLQEQSQIPDQDNRFGYLIAKYDVEVDGGTGAVEFGATIPDNTAVVGGYVYVAEAVLPATATQAIHLVSANDLLTAGTTLQSTGLFRLGASTALSAVTLQRQIITNVFNDVTNVVPVVTNVVGTSGALASTLPAAPVYSTSDDQIDVTWTGSTATQGVFFVVLDLIKMQ